MMKQNDPRTKSDPQEGAKANKQPETASQGSALQSQENRSAGSTQSNAEAGAPSLKNQELIRKQNEPAREGGGTEREYQGGDTGRRRDETARPGSSVNRDIESDRGDEIEEPAA
jgi:hypothetical protein